MLENEEKSLKSTGIYRTPDNIANFKLRIQWRLDSVNIWQQQDFIWQRKSFSKWEQEFYKNEQNCVTDLDKKYHNEVVNLPEKNTEFDLYCYINDDDYQINDNYNNYLIRCDETNEFDMNQSILDAIQNPVVNRRQFEVMYIMADLGEYIETTWIKNEIVLCMIRYDNESKILLISPDFTIDNYYTITINSKEFCYKIENQSPEICNDELHKQNELYQKIIETKLNYRQQLVGNVLKLPPKNRLDIHLFVEILWAKQFEHNPIFLQYFIDLPKNWTCNGQISGITPLCYMKNDNTAHFCHGFEIVLSYNIEELQLTGTVVTKNSNQLFACLFEGIPQSPYMYFEIVSRDRWNRHRTEGLTYKNLPISKPGQYNYDLQCFRFVPDTFIGGLRRFFIGDYRCYDDLTWIGLTNENRNDTILNKYGINTLGTGQLSIRINVLHQSQAFLDEFMENSPENRQIFEKLKCSTLVKSVEQVLTAFRRARRNMIEAKKNL